jgi:hypothetical protein
LREASEKIPMKSTDFRYARAFLRLNMAAAALLCSVGLSQQLHLFGGQEQLRVAGVIMKWFDERVEDASARTNIERLLNAAMPSLEVFAMEGLKQSKRSGETP